MCHGKCDCSTPCESCPSRGGQDDHLSLIIMILTILGQIPAFIIEKWVNEGNTDPREVVRRGGFRLRFSLWLADGKWPGIFTLLSLPLLVIMSIGVFVCGLILYHKYLPSYFSAIWGETFKIALIIIIVYAFSRLSRPYNFLYTSEAKSLVAFGQFLQSISRHTGISLNDLPEFEGHRFRDVVSDRIIFLVRAVNDQQHRLWGLGEKSTNEYERQVRRTQEAEKQLMDAYDLLQGFGLAQPGVFWDKVKHERQNSSPVE